jgi:hypothetical protein
MSQFVLCVVHSGCDTSEIDFHRVSGDQAVLQEAAVALLPDGIHAMVPSSKTGEEISVIFDEAHDSLINGRSFASTRLSQFLPELLRWCDWIAIWWGTEWRDLPFCGDAEEFVLDVVRQLSDPIGDVYLQWRRTPRNVEVVKDPL